jgi:hypothetical protein
LDASAIGIHALDRLIVGLAGLDRARLRTGQILILEADDPQQDVRGVADLPEGGLDAFWSPKGLKGLIPVV